MKYKCNYISGGGRQYDGGIWEIRETEKVIKCKILEKPYFETYEELTIKKDNTGKHCLRYKNEKEMLVYPDRNGVPYYFEAINSI